MSYLCNASLEQRCRRQLKKYGFNFHKSKDGYTVYWIDFPDIEGRWFGSLYKLLGFAEELKERYDNGGYLSPY